MPETGDKQRCSYPGCHGEMVLHERRMTTSAIPQQIGAGQPFPTARGLQIWICEMNPKRHVEVRTWGTRPVKDCSVQGCSRVMVHTEKARSRIEGEIKRSRPGQRYAMLEWEPGWICLDNETHFDPAQRP